MNERRTKTKDDRALAADAPFPEEHDERPDGSHARWIPRTTPEDHVTRSPALNLRGEGMGRCGDWHTTGWRTRCQGVQWHAHQVGTTGTDYYRAEYEELIGIIGTEEVVDARKALRGIGHPAGNRSEPVWFATHVRAVIEEAWGPIRRDPSPNPVWPTDPTEVSWWLCTPPQWEKLHELAQRIADTLEPGSELHARWLGWKERQSPRAHYTRPHIRWKGIEEERRWMEEGHDERTA